MALLLTGCATGAPPRVEAPPTPAPAPPKQAPTRPTQTGVASWYGRAHHGQPTASGETYDMHAMTAAHPTLPLGSRVLVTNVVNQRSVEVRINDRGPVVRGRIIDLSYAAAQQLGSLHAGTFRVSLRVLSEPSETADASPRAPTVPATPASAPATSPSRRRADRPRPGRSTGCRRRRP